MLITQETGRADVRGTTGGLWLLVLVFIALLLSAHVYVTGSEVAGGDKATRFKIPQSIKAEHEELHAGLAAAVKSGGKVAAAAREVEEVMHPHFVAEEEYALPPLGLLPSLAQGGVQPWMADAIPLTQRLKTNLPRMLQEHKLVAAALEKLGRAALEEQKPEHARFAENLLRHAHNEEEVLYPAAILVGEHLKLRLKK